MKITFGWYKPTASAYLQLVIDDEKKTVTRGYYLSHYTEIKVKTRKQLDKIQDKYINAGYTLIND